MIFRAISYSFTLNSYCTARKERRFWFWWWDACSDPQILVCPSFQNSFLYHTYWLVYIISSHKQKTDCAWVYLFLFIQLISKNQHKLLQLHKHLNINYAPLNKFILLSRRRQTLRNRGLNEIDFMHINYGEYQILPETTYTHNTNTQFS